MDFCAFDAEYVRRLTEGDPATETHFNDYFRKYVFLKMRARNVSAEMAEDVIQETLLRVLKSLRQGPGVGQPERFGAFVNAVSNNVLMELTQKQSKHPPIDEEMEEPCDGRADPEAALISAERKKLVARVLDELSTKDREILRLIFFEELTRKDICERLNVDQDYLRVLLYRAKGSFEAAYERKHGPISRTAGILFLFITGLCNGIVPILTIKMEQR